MDAHSLTALARVRCLLVPLGQITPQRFHELAARLQKAYEVRLGDVTGTDTRHFNPLGFPSGRIIYDFATSMDSQEALFLHDFEPFRKTFVVVGLADTLYEGIGHDLGKLKKSFSTIVSCAVIFDQGESSPSANVILCNKQNNPETVMCDVTRLFLIELNAYLSSYQHITLRSPGQLGSNDRAKPMPPSKNKRISSGASIGLTLNSDSGSKLSFKTANERRQARIKGRQTKILGNLLLLAGKYTDALKELNEAIVQLRAGNDYLWLGSALEGVGVCLFMLSFLGMSYQIPTSVANVLVSSNITSVMSPSSTPSASPRSSTATITAGGASSPALNGNGGTHPATSSTSKHSADLEKLPLPDLLMKVFEKVIHFYELSQNDAEDYVPSLVYCESILRFLKFMAVLNIGGGLNNETINHIVRGKPFAKINNNDVFDKSEILKISNKIMSIQLKKMDILSQTRIYTSLASLYGDLGFERKKSFMIRTLFVSLIPQLNTQAADSSTPTPLYDLQDVINTILSVYGISLCTESDIKDAFSSKWIQLQKSIIKLCISVCEEIQDFSTVVALKSLLLTRFLDALTDNEQHKVYKEIQDISRRNSLEVSYFDPFILRGVHLVRPSNPPMKQTKQAAALKKSNDPLIYNPYAKTEVVEKNYVVQEEFTEFLLVLQNPYAFPIVINDIKMKNVEILRTHFTIAPKTLQKINILTKPHTPGEMIIDSVSLKIGECNAQWFKIAKSQKIKTLKKLKEGSTTTDILSSYTHNLSSNNITSRVEVDSLSLNVIPAQPSLQVLNTPEPLMLLEGGKHRLTIVLKNNSSVNVNVLEFSIWDNTIEPLKKGLENKDLPADEVYEFEYYLYKQSLEILSDIKEIKPFEEVPLEVEVQGKRGVNKINLILDYGHSLEGGDVFTRSLEIPITAIVHSSTDLADCNIVPLNQEIDESKHELWKFIKSSGGSISDWVLFLVDFRNLWNKALDVEIEFEGYKTQKSIVPMETKRLILPIKRIDLDYENIDPIPSLSGKQYIVPKISKAEDQFQRETFWYREEILKKVKGTWSAGGVSGNLEMRAVRLTQKMLNVLKVDKVGIEIKIPDAKTSGLHHEVKTGDFITVVVEITNHTTRTLKGIIRNIPTATNYGLIDRRLLFNGMLQQRLSRSLEPGESLSLPIGAVVLERGEYEWGAVLDEQDNDAQYICRRPLRIKAF